jgi:hypothetical protein
VRVVDFSAEHEEKWDAWCAGAVNGTFLHSRRFLKYHRGRFTDASSLLMEAERIVGVFPAAIALDDPKLVVSHPGATYGGIVHHGRLRGTRMIEALSALRSHYSSRGFHTLLYKAVPHIYMLVPAQDDIYALARLGARKAHTYLSASIDLENRRQTTERLCRGLRKAQKIVTISNDISLLGELWTVLEHNLERKYGVKPTHSREEITVLQELFPDEIGIRCALLDGKVEAGIVLFNSPQVWHTQYIATSERGCQVRALIAVLESAIEEARGNGVRHFDLGTSNEKGGTVLNDGLYRFKTKFGAGGLTYEFYELDLTK